MTPKIRLDSAGIAELLGSAGVASAVAEAGASIAANVNAQAGDEPIEVLTRTRQTFGKLSGRTAVDITLAHPAAQRVEALRGPLAAAAAAAGYEVSGG